MVERNLAKVDVAGSNPVSRSASSDRGRGHSVIAPNVSIQNTLPLKVAPPPPIPPGGGVLFCGGSFFASCTPWISLFGIGRRTQVVRERSAKPLCGGSNPPDASTSWTRLPRQSKSLPVPHPDVPTGRCDVAGEMLDSDRRSCRGGGIGRRTGLKILRAERSVPVQIRPSVRVQWKASCYRYSGRLAQLVRALP